MVEQLYVYLYKSQGMDCREDSNWFHFGFGALLTDTITTKYYK